MLSFTVTDVATEKGHLSVVTSLVSTFSISAKEYGTHAAIHIGRICGYIPLFDSVRNQGFILCTCQVQTPQKWCTPSFIHV